MPRKKDRSHRCERPGCSRAAKFTSPANWCNKHFNQWWDYGIRRKKEPRWMTHPRSRPISQLDNLLKKVGQLGPTLSG